MILSGPEIEKQYKRGKIKLTPWSKSAVGPCSVNFTLSPEIWVYRPGYHFSVDRPNPPDEIHKIGQDGFILRPGYAYLGRTAERIELYGYAADCSGRSSTGRMFWDLHKTAGFIDDGFCGYVTLEMTSQCYAHIRAGMEVGQYKIYPVIGKRRPYVGKYQNNNGIQSTRIFLDRSA